MGICFSERINKGNYTPCERAAGLWIAAAVCLSPGGWSCIFTGQTAIFSRASAVETKPTHLRAAALSLPAAEDSFALEAGMCVSICLLHSGWLDGAHAWELWRARWLHKSGHGLRQLLKSLGSQTPFCIDHHWKQFYEIMILNALRSLWVSQMNS